MSALSKSIFFLTSFLLLNLGLQAQERLKFSFGDRVQLFADKTVHIVSQQKVMASGNVIIILNDETLYGDRASFDKQEGLVEVEGHVRYEAPDLTLIGSKILYHTQTKELVIKKATITNQVYTITGDEIRRISKKVYKVKKAEFSTCLDCPESWSFFGEKVTITQGEYLKAKNVLFKVKGVPAFYLPYIVLPIKTKRQTGLLFPNFILNNGEGVTFQQPWFWAISPSSDTTISPTLWGERGWGGELEGRKAWFNRNWSEFKTTLLADEIYQPDKNFFRHFSRYEQHFEQGRWLNHHLRMNDLKDLDFLRDFRRFTEPEVEDSTIGLNGFVDLRSSYGGLSTEAGWVHNQLVSDPLSFDSSYVQTLPRMTLAWSPQTIRTSLPLIRSLIFGGELGLDRFKQDQTNEVFFLRNATRLRASPFLDWIVFNNKGKYLKTRLLWDAQYYEFDQTGESSFGKENLLTSTELGFQLEKVYGVAYQERIPLERLEQGEFEAKREESNSNSELIENVPRFTPESLQNYSERRSYAYKHTQDFKFLYHYRAHQAQRGNPRFATQIESREGWFDFWDANRAEEFLLGSNESRKAVSPLNTLEFQWNNNLIRKSPRGFSHDQDQKYLKDQFSYQRMAYFNFSQGLELRDSDGEENKLTRLHAQLGAQMGRWNFSFEEFFFHDQGETITSLSLDKSFSFASLGGSLFFNSLTIPETQNIFLRGSVSPLSVLTLRGNTYYDLTNKDWLSQQYGFTYKPKSRCWMLELDYIRTAVDYRLAFNFLFNFNGAGFR